MGLAIEMVLLSAQWSQRYVVHLFASLICLTDGCGVLYRCAAIRNATGRCLPTTAAASARGAGSA